MMRLLAWILAYIVAIFVTWSDKDHIPSCNKRHGKYPGWGDYE